MNRSSVAHHAAANLFGDKTKGGCIENILVPAKLLEMAAGKRHGLGAGKVGVLAAEQAGDLAAHAVEKIALGPDAGVIHGLDATGGFVHGGDVAYG